MGKESIFMIITVTPNPVLDRTLTVADIEFNAVLRASDVRLDWGGKGFNVSRTLQVLGAESLAMGFVGGATGDMLEQGLHGLGIKTDFVRIGGETRTNIVITEPEAERHIKVNEAGPAISAGEQQAFFQRIRERIQLGDICVMAGSLPPGLPASFYSDLITILNKIGAISVLDASGEAVRLGWLAGPTMVKPNALEASDILDVVINSTDDAVQAAKSLLQHGVRTAAISLGAGGLVLADEDNIVLATPPAIQERNAVGAGDALAAGLVWALDQGLGSADIARWGVATGTASAAVEGVASGSLAEIETILAAVQISTFQAD
jgi:1-phosphofructokinase family hexose kinase